jgi:hypothetical protein
MNVERVVKREVRACRPDDTLNRAAQLMWDNACGCVPIVRERPANRNSDRSRYLHGRLHAGPTLERDYGSKFDGPQGHHLSH